MNECNYQNEWLEFLNKKNIQNSITPKELTVNSDCSSYQTALNLLIKSNEKYDYCLFLHTQGNKSGRHDVRNRHLNLLINKNLEIFNFLENNLEYGSFGLTLTQLGSYFDGNRTPTSVYNSLDKYLKNDIFSCTTFEYFFVGTMFYVRYELLNKFLTNCNNIFFKNLLFNYNEPNIGDLWFIERDFLHFVDRLGHLHQPKFIINNYPNFFGHLNDLETENRYFNEINNWIIINNLNYDINKIKKDFYFIKENL